MTAVLRDALHVQNASVVFAAGGGGLSADGLLSGLSSHLAAARAAGRSRWSPMDCEGEDPRCVRRTVDAGACSV